jgi:Zinc carboxypeptidase
MKFGTAVLCLLGCLYALGDGVSDSGIRGPRYLTQLKEMEKLRAENPDLISLIDYGTTKLGNTLRMIVLKKETTNRKLRPTLVMSGSTHGSEYLNIEDRLPRELTKKAKAAGPVAQFIKDGGVLVFIPILNPDGYDAHQRENAEGVDLNRDWTVKRADVKGFREPETRLLAERLEKLRQEDNLQFKVTVDYHCCAGAFLYPWSFRNAPPIASRDSAEFHKIGEMVTRHLGIETGRTGEILGYYPSGTTKDYYFDRYHAMAFTYEGRYLKEPRTLPQHVAWWEEMIESLEDTPSHPLFAARSIGKKTVLPKFAD